MNRVDLADAPHRLSVARRALAELIRLTNTPHGCPRRLLRMIRASTARSVRHYANTLPTQEATDLARLATAYEHLPTRRALARLDNRIKECN